MEKAIKNDRKRNVNQTEIKWDYIVGHVLEVLSSITDNSIDCIPTSPPYWGLRNYGENANRIWDGDPTCKHEWSRKNFNQNSTQNDLKKSYNCSGKKSITSNHINSNCCTKCNAWYGQLGLEPTLDLYLTHLWQIADQLYRVLRPSGVMFWNHGDNYSGSGCGTNAYKTEASKSISGKGRNALKYQGKRPHNKWQAAGVPAKCMALQNYRFILGLIDIDYRILVEWRVLNKPENKLEDMLKNPRIQYILRNQIIWHKLNHMPSSAQDRFTNAHEPVFMLVKNKKYWFDLDAVRQPYTKPLNRWGGNKIKIPRKTKWKPDDEKTKWSMSVRERKSRPNPLGKNPGDVWLINTTAYSGAHFAVFPEKLIKPMIKSTCPERICRKCGKARIRITKHDKTISEEVSNNKISSDLEYDGIATFRVQNCSKGTRDRPTGESISINWTDCGCNAGWRSGVILDPFAGSGTSILVGRRLGRNAIGIDINEKYKELAISRMKTFESEINSNLLSENQTL